MWSFDSSDKKKSRSFIAIIASLYIEIIDIMADGSLTRSNASWLKRLRLSTCEDDDCLEEPRWKGQLVPDNLTYTERQPL